MASAHGWPKIFHPADSAVDAISLDNFENPPDRRARMFVSLSKWCNFLEALFQYLARYKEVKSSERARISSGLEE